MNSLSPMPQRLAAGLRRMGLAGIVFFTLKGLLWVFLPLILARLF